MSVKKLKQYLGKTIRVELDEGKAIAGVCSKVTKAAKSPVKENSISITIMDTMDIEILESEIKNIEVFTWETLD